MGDFIHCDVLESVLIVVELDLELGCLAFPNIG